MAIICGVREGDGVSDYYKAFLTQRINGQDVTIVGYVSEETRITMTQLWSSPFEGETAGNQSGVQVASGLAQNATDKTSVSLLNSKLIWEGAEPLTFNLIMVFSAYADAKKEVDDPISLLLQMSSPELEEELPMGQRPSSVILDLGRKLKTPVVIRSVSYDTNAPKTKNGHFAYNRVEIECSINGAINASQIPNVFL